MAAPTRKFLLTTADDVTAVAMEPIDADRFDVGHDGSALFYVGGFLVDARAPGTWRRIVIEPTTEGAPRQRDPAVLTRAAARALRT